MKTPSISGLAEKLTSASSSSCRIWKPKLRWTFNFCLASSPPTPPIIFPIVRVRRGAECDPVNEILVISPAHCLSPSGSPALLCIREELSVPLVSNECNGTEPAEFHGGSPWPSCSNRPGWSTIMWDLVCKNGGWIKMEACRARRWFWGSVSRFAATNWMDHSEQLLRFSSSSSSALEIVSSWEILRLICSIMRA